MQAEQTKAYMQPPPINENPKSKEFPRRLITTTPANPKIQPVNFLPVNLLAADGILF